MARRRPRGSAKSAIDNSREDTMTDPLHKERTKKKETPAAPFFENHALTPIKIFASDKLDSSSSDVCEVEWDARSPITMSQVARYKSQSVDTSELVKNYAEGRPPQSCTPPLLSLWRDHSDSDDGSNGIRYRAQRLQRGKGRRTRGRPSGVKASVSSKEMFLQLESVLETRPDEDEPLPLQPDNQQRRSPRVAAQSTSSSSACPSDHSFELFESEEPPPLTSTQKILPQPENAKVMHLLAPSPIQKTNKSPLREKLKRQNSAAENVTPKRPTPVSERLRSASVEKNVNQSVDDLWSDEDLFDDSFIIRATQGGFNGITPPRALKRKTPHSSPEVASANKCGRYTFTIGSATKERPGLSHLATVGVKQERVDPQLPYRSYYNRSNKSPLSKTSEEAQQPQHPKTAKEFKFVKPHTCKSPLAVTGPRHSVSTTGLRQSSTETVSTHSAKSSALKSGNNVSIPSSSAINTKRLNTNLSTKCQNKPVSNQSSVLPAPLAPPALPTGNKLKNKLIGRVQGIEPIRIPEVPNQKRNTDKPVRHSTPQRRAGVAAIDTSLTDDLLAALAEPDELLDSQMVESELLDSQTYRDVLSLSPPEPAVLDPCDELDEHSTELCAGTATGVLTGAPMLNSEAMEQIPEDTFDDFMDEDEALSEQQLLAMLEIVESQASQESCPRQSKNTTEVSGANALPVKREPRQAKEASQESCPRQSKNTTEVSGASVLPVKREPRQANDTTEVPVSSVVPVKREPVFPPGTNPFPVIIRPHIDISAVKIEPNTGAPHSVNTKKSPTSVTRSGASSGTMSQPQSSEGDTKPTQTASQKYSKEDIERKKQEALKRRQNRLKLGTRLK